MDTQRTDRSGPRVLLVGYSGANNTGAEALLLADIEDMRAVFGPDVRITIPTINPANLRRYVQEGPDLRIASMPTIFFAAAAQVRQRKRPGLPGRGQHVHGYVDLRHAVGLSVDDALRARDGQAVHGLCGGRRRDQVGPQSPPGAQRGQQDRPDHHPRGSRGRASARLGRHGAHRGHGRQRLHVCPRSRRCRPASTGCGRRPATGWWAWRWWTSISSRS